MPKKTNNSNDKKKKFIENWRITRGNITKCCSIVNINRSTYYDWLEKDENFARGVADAEAELNDDMREALIDKGAGGDLGAIIFYLKNKHPEFKEKQINFGGGLHYHNHLEAQSKKYELPSGD